MDPLTLITGTGTERQLIPSPALRNSAWQACMLSSARCLDYLMHKNAVAGLSIQQEMVG